MAEKPIQPEVAVETWFTPHGLLGISSRNYASNTVVTRKMSHDESFQEKNGEGFAEPGGIPRPPGCSTLNRLHPEGIAGIFLNFQPAFVTFPFSIFSKILM